MRIMVFNGKGNARIFTGFICRAFKKAGHKILNIELAEKYNSAQIAAKIKRFNPDFSFAVNCIGPLIDREIDFFDKLELPHFTYLIDHPVRQVFRFKNPQSPFFTIACIDKTHLDYLRLIGKKDNILFLPHAVASDWKVFTVDDSIKTEREIIFCGRFNDSETFRRRVEEKTSSEMMFLIDETVKKLKTHPDLGIHQAFQMVLKRMRMGDLVEDVDFMNSILVIVETIIRRENRYEIINSLRDFDLHIYGGAIDNSRLANSKIKFKSAEKIGKREMLKKMARSKLVLNISDFFPHGSHVRIPNSLVVGRPILSTQSSYFSETFGSDRSVVPFQTTELKSLPGKVLMILSDYQKYRKLALEDREEILKNHTWSNRAAEIISFMEGRLEG